ncbi:hypothetical protein Lal_00025307 [Lupinus albus]|uniref:Putative transcription factor bZIP family n=1 Tax=Lupinus albus TaxID=3870 RepID=A0A6A4PW42_LUPAL|nr:putative transcription factor bZIP family [Lupinus albus]KAF1889977.1 hypothetical protein Lal_00025307 [Lupinus albus]
MNKGSPNRAQGSKFPALVRDGPLYNFSFNDEVQSSHLGHTVKPLHHNMHVDELVIQNVISSSENGQILVPNTSSPCSLGCLNGTSFGNKSMNEMWREMVQEQQFEKSMENNHLQKSSIGEIEDYYVPPAAIADSQPLMPIDPMVIVSQQQQDWFPLPMQMHMEMQVEVPTNNVHQQEELQHHEFNVSSELVYENPVYEMVYSSENSMVAAMSPSTCSETKGGGGVFGRKRMHPDEMMEKTIERRQKRMAKNRESAAKSRAKKQVSLVCCFSFPLLL